MARAFLICKAAFLTLVLTIVVAGFLGAHPAVGFPVALAIVLCTWTAHDLYFWLIGRSPWFRKVFTWAFDVPRSNSFRDLYTIVALVQFWLVVAIAPALLTWWCSLHFVEWMPTMSFGLCLVTAVGSEIWLPLVMKGMPERLSDLIRNHRA